MIIAIPSVQRALNNAKAGIGKINENNLKEAGKELGTEILFCDSTDTALITNLKTIDASLTTCKIAKEKIKTGINVTVEQLKNMQYFEDTANNCTATGSLSIVADDNGKITVTLTDVSCKK
jgi:hypothetical protein